MHTVRTHTHTHTPKNYSAQDANSAEVRKSWFGPTWWFDGAGEWWTDSGSVQEVKSTRFNERLNVGVKEQMLLRFSLKFLKNSKESYAQNLPFPRKSKTFFFFLLWNAFVLRIRWKVGVGNWGWEPNSNIFKSSFTKSAVAWIGLQIGSRCLSGPCYWSYTC